MSFQFSNMPTLAKLAALLMAAFLTTAHAAPAADKNQILIRQLQKVAIDSLKDPDSAKFKDMFLGFSEDAASSVRSLCGLVNAKNSMGGYVGFTPFIVKTDGYFSMRPEETTYMWPVWCNRNKPKSD